VYARRVCLTISTREIQLFASAAAGFLRPALFFFSLWFHAESFGLETKQLQLMSRYDNTGEYGCSRAHTLVAFGLIPGSFRSETIVAEGTLVSIVNSVLSRHLSCHPSSGAARFSTVLMS
jgi:hypothetical protein